MNRFPHQTRRRCACFGLVAGLALVAYARSFTGAFQFDDYSQILESPGVRQQTADAILRWGRARIVPYGTLVLNHWIGGENPLGYHVVNFFIHLVASFAVFQLGLALCQTPRLRHTRLAERPLAFATSAAVLFACHPIAIQAVTYIVQRMSSMAAMFYIGSVLLYVTARNAGEEQDRRRARRAFVGSGLLALAAFFSKENTASLPLAILLTEWAFFGAKGLGRTAARVAPFFVLVLAIPLTWKLLGAPPRVGPPGGDALGQQANELARLLTWTADPTALASPRDYFLTQCLVIPRYIRLIFLPWGFNVDHDVPVARELSAAVAAGLAFLVTLLGFGAYAVKRWPAVGFGILWFFVTLSVESSIFPIRDMMNEHRVYLAMPGVALAVAAVFCGAVRRQPAAALGAGAVVAVSLVALTVARNEVWRTQLSLWSDALEKSPNKARVHVNVGTALHLEGKPTEAMAHYCRALAIDPGNRRAESNINIALDDLLETGEVELVIEEAREDGSVTLVPRHPCPPKR